MKRPFNTIFAPLLFGLALSVYGCATIINGSTQDVPVDVPRGIRIADTSGEIIPLLIINRAGENGTYISLQRKRDYILRFSYKGQEISTRLRSNFDAGWIILDFLSLYGLIADVTTDAWSSFDGIAVRFPTDSLKNSLATPFIEGFDPSPPKIGINLIANTGFVFPIGNGEVDFAFFNCYRFGLGYELTHHLTVLGSYGSGGGIDIMPLHTHYETFGRYSSADLEARLRIKNNIYLVGGGGWTHITSDTLKYRRYGSDSSGRQVNLSILTSPADVWMPTLFAGLGISGSLGFFELRHTFGLSKIQLSNGETGKFETTSITFGLNLRL